MTIMIDKAHFALFYSHSLIGPTRLSMGQKAMNALTLYRPDLARVLPDDLNPVTHEHSFDAFMHWVVSNW